VLLSLALCWGGVRAFGQAQNTGQVAGNVVDATKHTVAGAAVTLTSEERGNVLSVTTNAEGEYTFNDVPSGSYTLMVVAPTFEKYVADHVAVDADSHLRLDATMKAGSVSAEVEVTAGTAAIDTQSATVGAVIDNNLVENLPIDGNNVIALAALLPGVTDVSAPATFTSDTGGASFTVNGARGTSNLFLFDGLLWNNLYLNTPLNYPNHAALQAVSIQLNNFTAQYGRNSGSIVNIISKSGTNQVHGEAFISYQNGAVDAADYFTKLRPQIDQYQFGAAVGGPIIKDKLFYEAEYQELLSNGTFPAQASTLSYAERGLEPDGVTPLPCTPTGEFASYQQCANFSGDAITGVSPNTVEQNFTYTGGQYYADAIQQMNSTWVGEGHTGTNPCVTLYQSLPTAANTAIGLKAGYVVNAEVPSICWDPAYTALLAHINMPVPTLLEPDALPLAASTVPQPKHEYGGNLRVDWNASSRHIIDAHFYKTYNNDATPNGETSVANYEPDFNIARITAGSIGDTWVLGPSLLNVLRVGYKRYVYGVTPTDPTTLQELGSNFPVPGIPELPAVTVDARFSLGSASAYATNNVNEDIEATDTLSYTHLTHNIQTGVDFLRNQYDSIRATPGNFTFNDHFANDPAVEAMLGLVQTETIGNNRRISAIQHAVYGYVQDTWRAASKLTIIAGVRYELPWMWYQPKGNASTFIRGYQSQRFANAPANLAFVGDAGVPRALTGTDYTNLSPRIGISYDLFGNGKTALRAGFGTFYDATNAQVVGIGEPFFYTATYAYGPGSFSNPLYTLPAIPANFSAGQTPAFTNPQSIVFPDPHFKNAYTIGVNLGIQHQMNKGTVVEANYIGRFSRHDSMPYDLNPSVVDCSGSYFQSNPTLYCYADLTTTTQTNSWLSNNAPNGWPIRSVYPGFNYGGQGVVDYSSHGTGNYNAFQAIYTQRAFANLTMLASYTFSKAMDTQSDSNTTNELAQPNNVGWNYGPSNSDARHIYNMGFRLKLPTTLTAKSWVKAVVNDWNFNGIYNARTGQPLTPLNPGDMYGSNEPGQRLQLLPGMTEKNVIMPSNRHRVQKIGEWFNIAALEKPTIATYGNTGRNYLPGPAYINTTFSMTKEIELAKVREGMRAQFRFEALNVFNTVNLGTPGLTISTATIANTFGVIQGDANGARKLQFGFLLYF